MQLACLVGMFPAIRGWLGQRSKDWRVRTTVPTIVIHAAAFLFIALAVRHELGRSAIEGFRRHVEGVLEECGDAFVPRVGVHLTALHGPATVADRLTDVLRRHEGITLRVVAPSGEVRWPHGEALRGWESEEVTRALAARPSAVQWGNAEGGDTLVGVKLLHNEPSCQPCHRSTGPVLAALVGSSASAPVAAASGAWATRFAVLLGSTWVVLALFMGGLRTFVIGRPLARIERDIQEVRREPGASEADLDTLADRIHRTIWDLLEREKHRREDLTRQMARAEQMAALGSVAAGLSHEIKNPLAGIRTAVEVLAKDELDPQSERARVFQQIVEELDRVVRTVENLLRLGRPQKASRMPAHLDRIVQGAATLFEPQLRDRSVKLALDVGGPIPTLELDSNLVMQLVLNLLTNAGQAVKPGGTVRVIVAPFPLGDGAVLSVVDDGVGISPENLERVFEPFFTTKATGTGLGLPLCRQIVEQHGGTISVESAPGHGTKVVALFPAARQVEP